MLVGRDAERQVIERLLAGARVGQSGCLVLVGEAGIGKSALLDEAAAGAHGMQVLRATGIDADRTTGFGGLLQLLRPALHLLDDLPGPQADALATALALRARGDVERFAVGAATLTLICRYAEERPVLVLLDDAHLLDAPSAGAVAFAARRLTADPVAVLATVRADRSGTLTETGLPAMAVGGLDRAATERLVTEHSGRPVPRDLVDRLFRSTGGNPLALLELAEDVDGIEHEPVHAPLPVPQALVEAFTQRARSLDPAAATVTLLAAASDGELALVGAAAALLSVDLRAVADAERAGLVLLTPERVAFRHPLVRAAVYSSASAPDRRAAHAALAAALPDGATEPRAWHLSQAALGPDEEAARACEAAAHSAAARAAHEAAAGSYERAAVLSPDPRDRVRRLLAAGRSALLAGRPERAGALVEQVDPAYVDGMAAIDVEELRGRVAARTGSLRHARDVLVGAAEAAAPVDVDRAVRLLADAVLACFFLGDTSGAMTVAERLERLLPQSTGARARLVGTMATGVARVIAGEGGTDWIRRATDLFGAPDAPTVEPSQVGWLMPGPLFLREQGVGLDLVQQAVRDSRGRAALGTLPLLLFFVARYDATTERWADAETAYVESVRLARETGQAADLAASLSGLAWLNARQGREDGCRTAAAEALEICADREMHTFRAWSLFALAELELGRGDAEAALVMLQRLDSLLDEIGFLDADLSPGPEVVETLMRTGRSEEAGLVADRFRVRAQKKGRPWALARAARADGIVGPDDELDEHFVKALAHHALALDPFERARTELAYGARLRRARRRTDARPHLRDALATFDALGAAPWAQMAATELGATGETARRREPSTVDDLTPQERQIAQLLAGGRTTRQAAAALFLSPKTIEYHLRHVYTKLQVTSRDELATAMSHGSGGAADDDPSAVRT